MDERIEMRIATADDVEAIRRLTRDAYAKWIPLIGREPRPMAADYERAVANHRFDLLEIDGTLAALIETIDEGDHLLVENLAVSPDFQRRGLGSRLMAQAEVVARSLGHGELRLYTNSRFAGNVELYERLGYRVVDREDIGGGLVRVNMRKVLGWDAVTQMLVAVARERGGYAGFRSWFGETPRAEDGAEAYAVAKMAGYDLAPETGGLVELTANEALAALSFFTIDSMVMSTGRQLSESLTQVFEHGLARLGPEARFYSNGHWGAPRTSSTFGWYPLSEATFDGGVLGFNAEVGFIAWCEEED